MRYIFKEPIYESDDAKEHGAAPVEYRDVEVPREPWAWIARYADGTELYQFEDAEKGAKGVFHQFAEINRADCRALIMRHDSGREVHCCIPEGAQPFHFYRNLRKEHGDGTVEKFRSYVFGWKLGERVLYQYILPDHTVVTAAKDMQLEF